MDDKEAEKKETEQKAKMASDMHHKLADQHASAFEAWLNEHRDATKEEAHERLVQTIEMAIMLGVMSLMTL